MISTIKATITPAMYMNLLASAGSCIGKFSSLSIGCKGSSRGYKSFKSEIKCFFKT